MTRKEKRLWLAANLCWLVLFCICIADVSVTRNRRAVLAELAAIEHDTEAVKIAFTRNELSADRLEALSVRLEQVRQNQEQEGSSDLLLCLSLVTIIVAFCCTTAALRERTQHVVGNSMRRGSPSYDRPDCPILSGVARN